MSFDMQRMPDSPSDEAKKLYLWAAAYTFLGLCFGLLSLILLATKNPMFWISVGGTYVSWYMAYQRLITADSYDRFSDDER